MPLIEVEFEGDIIEFPSDMPSAEISRILSDFSQERRQRSAEAAAINLSPQVEEEVGTNLSQDEIIDIIVSSANKIGVPPEMAVAIADVESGLKPGAKNPNSSASGLFQFIESTWKDTVERVGLGHSVLELDILDPYSNTLMGVELIKQNFQGLQKFLGRDPTVQEVYLAHFSGLSGAKKILGKIEKDPEILAKNVWSKAAIKSNPSIFKEDIKASDVLNLFTRKVTRASEKHASRFVKQAAELSQDQEQQVLDTLAIQEEGARLDTQVAQEEFRRRTGIGEFATNASGDMKRIEGGLFEDPNGNLVVIDDKGNMTELNCG